MDVDTKFNVLLISCIMLAGIILTGMLILLGIDKDYGRANPLIATAVLAGSVILGIFFVWLYLIINTGYDSWKENELYG